MPNQTPKSEPESAEQPIGNDLFRDVMLGILRYVANESQKHPSDSVKDIVNEALDAYGLPFHAEWSDNDDQPISILANDQVMASEGLPSLA